eukprot:10633469-Karenia_brevis.AAC.2
MLSGANHILHLCGLRNRIGSPNLERSPGCAQHCDIMEVTEIAEAARGILQHVCEGAPGQGRAPHRLEILRAEHARHAVPTPSHGAATQQRSLRQVSPVLIARLRCKFSEHGVVGF